MIPDQEAATQEALLVRGRPGKPLHHRLHQVCPPARHRRGVVWRSLHYRALPAVSGTLRAGRRLLYPPGREGVDHTDRDPDGVSLMAHHNRDLPD